MTLDFCSNNFMGIIQLLSLSQQTFKVTRTMGQRIKFCFGNTRHLTQTKGRSLSGLEALPHKECKRGFIATPNP